MQSNTDLINTLTAQNQELRTNLELVTSINKQLMERFEATRESSIEPVKSNIIDLAKVNNLAGRRISDLIGGDTRLDYEGITISIKHPHNNVTAIYPNGVEISWTPARPGQPDTDGVIYMIIDNIEVEVSLNKERRMEVSIFKEGKRTIELVSKGDNRFTVSYDESDSIDVYGKLVANIGKSYECKLSSFDDSEDQFTITDIDKCVYLYIVQMAAPIIRISDNASFDCGQMAFLAPLT